GVKSHKRTIATPTGAAASADLASAKKGRKRALLLAGGGVLVIGLGFGGWMFFGQDSPLAQNGSEVAEKKGAAAEKELHSIEAGHWDRAAKLAETALSAQADNTEGLAILAQARYAAVLEEGTRAAARKAQGQKAAEKLRGGVKRTPNVEKALALQALM